MAKMTKERQGEIAIAILKHELRVGRAAAESLLARNILLRYKPSDTGIPDQEITEFMAIVFGELDREESAEPTMMERRLRRNTS